MKLFLRHLLCNKFGGTDIEVIIFDSLEIISDHAPVDV